APAAAPGGAEPWDAVEGFWIPRPWSQADTCVTAPGPVAPASVASGPTTPAAVAAPEADAPAPDASPTPSPERTAGLAAVFETGGSRLGRRQGQAYAYVIRGDKK